MKIQKEIGQVVQTLIDNKARVATKYLSDKLTIRASQNVYNGRISNGKSYITLTIGKPNYEAREFVKKCKKIGEPFPIKKIQLKFIKN